MEWANDEAQSPDDDIHFPVDRFNCICNHRTGLISVFDSLTLVNLKNSQQGVAGLRSELENQKQEAVKGATILALNSDIRKAVASKESSSLRVNITPIAEKLELDFVTITDDRGTVLARSYEDRRGDSIAGQALVQKALQGISQSIIEPGKTARMMAQAGVPLKNEQG